MSKPPIAAPHTEGRVFGSDWSIVNVATLLRANAARGMWRSSGGTGGYTPRLNHNYVRTASARHLPTSVNLIFMQLQEENCWYASICFAAEGDYLPWNAAAAELWLRALFGEDRPRVLGDAAARDDSADRCARQFTLSRPGA